MIEARSMRRPGRTAIRVRFVSLVILLLAAARPAAGQDWTLGTGFAVSVPRGEFGAVVGEGLGIGAHAVYHPPPGLFGLRFDAAYVTYGSERLFVPGYFSPRVGVDVTTRNNIAMVSLGPQLTFPAGPIEPYLNGFVGFGYFFTYSSMGRDPWGYAVAGTTNFDDMSLAYGLGGGLGIALSHGLRPVRLMVDAQWRHHQTTRYLREGSIEEDSFGNVLITFFESEVDLLLLRLGVSLSL